MLRRPRVKICGITHPDDARLAVALGADALGFIFFSGSPRCIAPREARAIIDGLPPFVTPVAVVVNAPLDEVHAIMAESGCHLVQAHGDEPPEYLERLPWPVIKGIPVARMEDLETVARYPRARAILLDTKVTGQYGGTGRAFDWEIARRARRFGKPLILAGGLCPENVAAALRAAEPDAVDIGSGIERAPGRKDHERMHALFAAIAACAAGEEA